MARIVDHLPLRELEARYRAAGDVAQARHVQAIWLLAKGRTVAEVAGVLAFTPEDAQGRTREVVYKTNRRPVVSSFVEKRPPVWSGH